VDAPLEASKQPAEAELLSTGEAKISVVEDDDAVRTFVVNALREHGFTVTAYARPEDILAVDALDADLVLTDVVMPNINGFELAERLQQHRKGLNVLFMTGFIDYNMVNDAAAAKHPHILRKPFTVRELLTSVQQNLNADRNIEAS
jgi:FixJ family two-component response regulator